MYALKNNIPRLKEDHDKAKVFADKLSQLPNLFVDTEGVQTNIIMLTPKKLTVEDFLTKCRENGLYLGTGKIGIIRAVTHMDVSFEEIEQAVQIIERIIS